ncbi:TPA: hypothetical protein P0E15_005162, partial [Vibrio harveyi]|nr:hypothetical protein [Vibrio harveyi]
IDLTDPEFLNLADKYPSYEALRVVNFADTNGERSLIGFKIDKNSENWDSIFSAEIGSNKDGKQKLYIYLAKRCSDDQMLEKTTIKTNGQNVRYHRFCDGNNIYITPLSKAGDNYLINEFKKKNSVSLEFSDIAITFDATGFTKGWNSYGGDAL